MVSAPGGNWQIWNLGVKGISYGSIDEEIKTTANAHLYELSKTLLKPFA